MKKILLALLILVVIVAGVMLINNKDGTTRNSDTQPRLKTYSSDGSTDASGQNNVGGSGSDTKPSSDGSDADNSLLSQ